MTPAEQQAPTLPAPPEMHCQVAEGADEDGMPPSCGKSAVGFVDLTRERGPYVEMHVCRYHAYEYLVIGDAVLDHDGERMSLDALEELS